MIENFVTNINWLYIDRVNAYPYLYKDKDKKDDKSDSGTLRPIIPSQCNRCQHNCTGCAIYEDSISRDLRNLENRLKAFFANEPNQDFLCEVPRKSCCFF